MKFVIPDLEPLSLHRKFLEALDRGFCANRYAVAIRSSVKKGLKPSTRYGVPATPKATPWREPSFVEGKACLPRMTAEVRYLVV